MSLFGSNQELLNRLDQGLKNLKNEKFSIDDFENLLSDSRELYERLLILRYKAFEKYRSGEDLPQEEVILPQVNPNQNRMEEIELAPIVEIQVPSDVEQLVVDSEPAGFEFAIFDDSEISETEELNQVVNEEPVVEIESTLEEEVKIVPPISQIEETNSYRDAQVLSNASNPVQGDSMDKTQVSGGSLLERLSSSSSQSNRLADQLKKSRIEAIGASLTLNDRIRFAKNLFGGNSETFNAAIQLLDSQRSMMDAQELLRQYAGQFTWNQEDKTTMDFYELVERRHA